MGNPLKLALCIYSGVAVGRLFWVPVDHVEVVSSGVQMLAVHGCVAVLPKILGNLL